MILRPRRARHHLWYFAPLSILPLILASCVPPPTVGETHVGRGELYRAGSAPYDEFFQAAHDAQTKAIMVLEEDKKARRPLAEALGQSDAPLDQLAKPAKLRAKKYGRGGASLRLETRGLDRDGKPIDGKKIVVTVKGAESVASDAEGKAFSDALAATAEAASTLLADYGGLPEQARKLAARADELRASLERDFPGAWTRRAEISDELGAAKLILLAAADRTQNVVDPIEEFFHALGERAEDEKVAQAPSTPAPSSPEPVAPKRMVTKSVPPAEPPAPKPKASRGDDFNP